LCTPISFCPIYHSVLTSFPAPGKRKRDKNWRDQKSKKKQEEIPGSQRCCLPFLLESWWSRIGFSSVTPTYLEKLMKHGFMVVAEHEACRVPEDLASRTPVEGYMVSFTAFYERGLGM
jgi:hypothetical protein